MAITIFKPVITEQTLVRIQKNTTKHQNDTINSDLPFYVTLLLCFPVETPCLSPACQLASAHLSMSVDPFMQPCDYFLFTCGSDRLFSNNGNKQRGQDLRGYRQIQEEKVMWPQRRAQSEEGEDGRFSKEKILDRQTVLLLHLREILGGSQQPKYPKNVHPPAFNALSTHIISV